MLGINSSADHRKPFHSHKKLRARQSLPSIMAAQRDPSRYRLLLPVLSAILALSSYLSAHGQWWLLHLQVSCSLEDRGRGVSEKKKIFFFFVVLYWNGRPPQLFLPTSNWPSPQQRVRDQACSFYSFYDTAKRERAAMKVGSCRSSTSDSKINLSRVIISTSFLKPCERLKLIYLCWCWFLFALFLEQS